MFNIYKSICSNSSRDNAHQLIQLAGWNACNNILYNSVLLDDYNSIDQFRFAKNIPSKCVILKRIFHLNDFIQSEQQHYDTITLQERINIYLEEKEILEWYLKNINFNICNAQKKCYDRIWWM